MPARIQILNGPNLNLLGTREPDKYGQATLDDLLAQWQAWGQRHNIDILHCQSNAEHVLIDAVHQARHDSDFIIFNPAAFTHTSVALRDALLGVALPFIEVHLSNVHAREPFRHHSYFSDIAVGVIAGLGSQGYLAALEAARHHLHHTTTHE